jgi:hypothetical protein
VGTSSLADLAEVTLIDNVLRDGYKSGYLYVGDRIPATATEPETFYFASNPVAPAGIVMSGTKRFGVSIDGVIRFDSTAANLGVPFDALTLAAAAPVAE